ncbi:MAG: ABC transporter ATP-binding protein [Oscillospiraceae bacterium]|nr:ABC transporter ATP-binding protein [Oscillospiraceae bacterium]
MYQTNDSDILLEIRDLDVSFPTGRGELRAVNGISYNVRRGEVMGIIGESGSGKSVEAYTILGFLKAPGKINAGTAAFEGRDLLAMSRRELETFRGREISMIFQNPMSCLDPVFTIGRQLTETLQTHFKGVSASQAREKSIEMLRSVGIRDADRLMKRYAFELSGGMRQRVMIAIALLCSPKLLIADEPTTALDVTTQAQILRLLKKLRRQTDMAMIYITHNFGIVAEICDRVSVMYGGYILEQGTVDDMFYRAAHPYTQALLKAVPRVDSLPPYEPLIPIEGAPVDPVNPPDGCVFHPRCAFCTEICRREAPPRTVFSAEHSASCWRLDGGAAEER